MNIPIPKYIDILKEQLLEPFFIFQVFCVILWCLDEYWYYSLFTLFMLLFFENMNTLQRHKNIKMFREMTREPKYIHVYRSKKWFKIFDNELLPNDLVAIEPTKENDSLPCDILLLEGNCVVDESMLTGETTPQFKENISYLKENDIISIKHSKRNILFGGTKVLLSENKGKTIPNQSCLGVVLKTGFETTQGKLIRTILFTSERVTVNDRESLLFLLILFIFAMFAASYGIL